MGRSCLTIASPAHIQSMGRERVLAVFPLFPFLSPYSMFLCLFLLLSLVLRLQTSGDKQNVTVLFVALSEI